MAWGNTCREAYTAGGAATLWSLEILNVIRETLGEIPKAPEIASRQVTPPTTRRNDALRS